MTNIADHNYNPEWQKNRIAFIFSKYDKEFFAGKTVLELGPFNGYIGARFREIGAKVHCIEGRIGNVHRIKREYPYLSVEHSDLDTDQWKWGRYDIILNFGLFYHLQNFHKEHLVSCIENCRLLFFETVVYDSYEPELYLQEEHGNDQSLTNYSGTPSTSYVENIFKECNTEYEKFSCKELNGGFHRYDWEDKNSKKYDGYARRFWINKTNR